MVEERKATELGKGDEISQKLFVNFVKKRE